MMLETLPGTPPVAEMEEGGAGNVFNLEFLKLLLVPMPGLKI